MLSKPSLLPSFFFWPSREIISEACFLILPPSLLPSQPNLRGDQIVNVVVNFPNKLSSREKELLQKLRTVQGGATGVGATATAAGGAAAAGQEGEGKEKGGWFGGF